MGFPSPAADYVEKRISLDPQLIRQSAATYFMPASRSHFREGILQGGAACCGCVTYRLRWFTAGMRNRWGIQDQALPNTTTTPPD